MCLIKIDNIDKQDDENFIFEPENLTIGPTFREKKLKIHRVLIVDDDQINITVLTRYFESFKDCVFDLAFNGQQAVDTVKKMAQQNLYYELILMDCNMPIMDGFTASRIILNLVQRKVINLMFFFYF